MNAIAESLELFVRNDRFLTGIVSQRNHQLTALAVQLVAMVEERTAKLATAVQDLESHIDVRSRPGVGSAFRVLLPVAP